jgi:hypothetical protein
MGHVFGFDEGVEFFAGQEAELQGGLAEAGVLVVGGVGDFGGVVVPDFGSEGGDEHEGVFDVVVDDIAIDFDAVDAVVDEGVAGVGEKFDGVEIVENHDRLENVKLEIALRAGKADGGVIAHYLYSDHGDGFALRGIYLARHDGRSRLIFWKREFA